MNISSGQLNAKLEQLEEKWFNALVKSGVQRPALANGRIQFFAMELPCGTCGAGRADSGLQRPQDSTQPCERCGADTARKLEELSGEFVVFCVGINYDQYPQSEPAYTPHLYNGSRGATWVIDNKWPVVRSALNQAFESYKHNAAAWHGNGYATSPSLLPPSWVQPPYPFTLCITNLSPFLSLHQWLAHGAGQQHSALAAWNLNKHICDLINEVGKFVDVWVVHGKSCVWPTFNANGGIANWILMPQLGLQNINRGYFKSFFLAPHVQNGARPLWPHCVPGREDMDTDIVE